MDIKQIETLINETIGNATIMIDESPVILGEFTKDPVFLFTIIINKNMRFRGYLLLKDIVEYWNIFKEKNNK